MKSAIFILTAASFVLIISFSPIVTAQKDKKPLQSTSPMLTRTTPRHENYRFAYGGTVTIVGAPTGSITIEAWQRNEVDVTAEIELHAGSAEDLDRLAAVNNFAIEEDANRLRIITTGTHDRSFMKRLARNFPKSLIGLPWKIDYLIKVPPLTDLEIDSGNGPIRLSGVEGALRINAIESDATLQLTGGSASVIIQRGTVNLGIPTRSWRGLGADVKLASGKLSVGLQAGFSGEIDAQVLRTGEIDIAHATLEPRQRGSISKQSVRARAGNGGAAFSFTVGDGSIVITAYLDN